MQQGNPTSFRVPDPGIAALFEQDARWQAWLDVEAALAKAEAELGMIPEAAAPPAATFRMRSVLCTVQR